jgi:putative acetyltransferase
MDIRSETENDWSAIYALNVLAFDTGAEANLVNSLRKCAAPYISLVAIIEEEVVGHIMFTPVELTGCSSVFIMGLAPMAVKESFRGKGVGSKLVTSGIAACEKLGAGAIVVLGHANYYPIFGFNPASRFNLSCEYDVPDEVFMALELMPEYLSSKSGVVKYHETFASV